jgi:plastocyanin
MARFLCTLALATFMVAGCGGSGEAGDPSGRTVDVKPNAVLRVSAEEYRFDVGTVVMQGAGRLAIDLTNNGSLAHDLVVRQDGRDVGGTPSFPPDETRKASVTLRKGRYEFLCTVGDHAKLGMRGTLVVR